ncbi:MAG TPA: hypothetical protein VE971_00270 [Candidatus Eisenbacteria bacterium]|nr:hypothetical protein [Candidatus Eisenbacteria bacterium]
MQVVLSTTVPIPVVNNLHKPNQKEECQTAGSGTAQHVEQPTQTGRNDEITPLFFCISYQKTNHDGCEEKQYNPNR